MILSVVLVGLAVWGARARMSDVDFGKHTMVTRPDVRAAAWIDQHLDPDARFLVNSFFAFGESSVVGADAGWWLPWLAHRATTLPPLVYVSEAGPRPDTIAWVNALTDAIRSNGVTHPDVIAELGARGVTHVYIGQQQGRVNWNGKTLDTKILLTDPNFRPVYHEDRVWIFELRR